MFKKSWRSTYVLRVAMLQNNRHCPVLLKWKTPEGGFPFTKNIIFMYIIMPKFKIVRGRKSFAAHRSIRRHNLRASAKPTTRQVQKIAQKIFDKNTEFLRLTDTLSATSIANITTGQILWKGPQLSGSTTPARKDDEILLRKLRFNVMFKSIGAPNRVRLVLVQYPQNTGAANTLADVLQDVTAQHVMISPWKKNGEVKYRILHNRVYQLGTKGVMDGEYKYQSFKFDIRFPKAGLKIHYENSTSPSPDKNGLVLYCVADLALTGANMNVCWAKTEQVFTDA